jgi:hypothetical protein
LVAVTEHPHGNLGAFRQDTLWHVSQKVARFFGPPQNSEFADAPGKDIDTVRRLRDNIDERVQR